MAGATDPETTSILDLPVMVEARDVELVPFVELAEGRLQGVVSSGSDVARVYCCFIEAGSLAYDSSTNNNRPDAGTNKRLRWLAEAAFAQFGAGEVVRALRVPASAGEVATPGELIDAAARLGSLRPEPSGAIFARFLDYLRLVELPRGPDPMPEMSWFVG